MSRARLRKRMLLAAVLAAPLAGCVVGKDYREPTTAPATLVNAGGPAFNRAAYDAAWWRHYGDPELDRLIARATAANTDVRVAIARVSEARAVDYDRYRSTLPFFFPTGRVSRSVQQIPGFGSGRVEAESVSAGFDALWEIDIFGRVAREREAAQADIGAELAGLDDARVTVAAEVARNYFELRGAQARLAVARRNLVSQEETLRITRVREEEGFGPEFDTRRASALAEATRATLPGFVEAERAALVRIEVLTGQRPGAEPGLLAPRPPRTHVGALPLGDAGALLRRRPDVRAAERRLAASTARIAVAEAARYPRLTLTGFLGFLTGDLGSLSNSFATSGAATIRGDTFDSAFGRGAPLLLADARAEQALAAYDGVVLAALSDVERSLLSYSQERDRLAALTRQAAQSRRAAQLARARYLEGAVDFLPVLEAEREQFAAEDAVAQSEARVNTAVAAVYKALGGGWEVAPPLPPWPPRRATRGAALPPADARVEDRR